MNDHRDLQEEPESTLGAKPTEHQSNPQQAPGDTSQRGDEHLTGSRFRREEGEESEDGREIRELEESRGLDAGAAPIASPIGSPPDQGE